MVKQKISTVLPLSIVIPTFCEEIWLPRLLRSIEAQVLRPLEVIVADSKSPDKTRTIAREYGAKIVEGGKIAFGRNAGAREARGEYILFMDADTELENELTLGTMFLEFIKKELDVASPKFYSSNYNQSKFGNMVGRLVYPTWNKMNNVQGKFGHPITAPGIAILAKKEVFERVNGFDETIAIGEDVHFFKKAKKAGYKYGTLEAKVKTSVRRFDSPKKVAKLAPWVLMIGTSVLIGASVGSSFLRKNSRLYGRLGGGKGASPTEE